LLGPVPHSLSAFAAIQFHAIPKFSSARQDIPGITVVGGMDTSSAGKVDIASTGMDFLLHFKDNLFTLLGYFRFQGIVVQSM
jgi:hypothetical protein